MLNFLTPVVRLIDRYLLLPPLSIIAVLRKPVSEPTPEPTNVSHSEAAIHGAAK